jgi:hypothetical protein
MLTNEKLGFIRVTKIYITQSISPAVVDDFGAYFNIYDSVNLYIQKKGACCILIIFFAKLKYHNFNNKRSCCEGIRIP